MLTHLRRHVIWKQHDNSALCAALGGQVVRTLPQSRPVTHLGLGMSLMCTSQWVLDGLSECRAIQQVKTLQ